jgi:hypothetical protein
MIETQRKTINDDNDYDNNNKNNNNDNYDDDNSEDCYDTLTLVFNNDNEK